MERYKNSGITGAIQQVGLFDLILFELILFDLILYVPSTIFQL